MGRRKRITEETLTAPAVEAWETAVYARLSLENSNKKDDGESIEGQVEICREYIEEQSYLHYADTYIDNGFTGTNTNRPGFQRLIGDIQKGKIKALVVKDFSRFSRDYIEAGNLLENIFPAMGVRFISVVDKYDSFDTDSSADSLLVPLKNLINDYYAKDISKKVLTAIHTKQMSGNHLPSIVPYGYIKSATGECKLEPDSETAHIVKRIFERTVRGENYNKIKNDLNNEHIPSPGKLRYMRGQTNRACYADCIWSSQVIKQILRNPTYLGHLVFGRMPSALCLGKPDYRYETDESKWRILTDSHEPLIDNESFETVKKIMTEKRNAWNKKVTATAKYREKRPSLFRGLIYCGECGSHLSYLYNLKATSGSYECHNFQYNRCTSRHTIIERKIADVVWQVIKDDMVLFADMESVVERLKNTGSKTRKQYEYDTEIKDVISKLKLTVQKRERLYEDYADGILSAEDYMYHKQKFDEEYADMGLKLNALESMQRKLNRTLSDDNRWLKNIKSMLNSKKLTRDIVETFVDRIELHDENGIRIEVKLKYNEDLKAIQSAYEELTEGAE